MTETVSDLPRTFAGYTRRETSLGHGSSGLVFECTKDDSRETFAVKIIDLRRLRLSNKAEREFKKLQREVDILKRVPQHPNLVRFVDAIEHGHWFLMIMELVKSGDLFTALMRRSNGASQPRFGAEEAAYVLRQLVEGLGFLHENGVIHRDLKLENVLVTREWQEGSLKLCEVKITDFGLSKVVGEGLSEARSTVGSPRYMAPEVLSTGVHDFRADLWSLGILLFVLLAGRFPADAGMVQQGVVDNSIARMDTSQDAKDTLSGLLQVDRTRRLSIDELRQKRFLCDGPPLPAPALPGGSLARDGAVLLPAKRPRTSPSPLARAGQAQPSEAAEEEPSTQSLFGSLGSFELEVMQDAQGEVPSITVTSVEALPAASPPEETLPETPSVTPSITVTSVEALPEASPLEAPRTPPREEDVVPIKELDRRGYGKAVQGTITLRVDHKTGGGFHLRIRDATGEIDVRFWDEAAQQFRHDHSLCRGSLVRFGGFRPARLQAKDEKFAPAGRHHNLNYNVAKDVHFEVVPVELT